MAIGVTSYLKGKKMACLDIPDEYEHMDPILIRLLENGFARHVRLKRTAS
jgi:predicted protein tyrosine phosphatase